MELEDIRSIAVLGTGTMAPGIAQVCAQSGYSVSMWGRTDASLKRGFDRIHSNLRTLRENDLLTEQTARAVLSRISGVKTIEEAAAAADFVIESIAEDMSLKKEAFGTLDRICAEGTILATNTSGLSVTEIAAATGRAHKVVATHFWSPPHLVPLVEVVQGDTTSTETVDVALKLMKKMGKTPVVVKKDAPGFIGNRLQFALLREALHIVEQGIASMEDVDATVKASFGRRLPVTGPLESADLGGLDVYLAISDYLMKDLCSSGEVPRLLAEAVEKGWLGAKSGRGFYQRAPEAISRLSTAREEQLIDFLKKDQAKEV